MQWAPADFYVRDGHRLRCTLCPHACELDDGDVGFCQVRRRIGERMETATQATSVRHLSPVERKPLYHFRPGIQVLTIASPGCSFTCHYCQNYRISQYGRVPEAVWSVEPASPEELVATAVACDRAIGLSYSEPSLAAELTEAIAEHARPAGVDLLWKTNGYLTPSAARRLVPCLAAVNLDIKTADERQHQKLTGASLAPVHEFLRLLVNEGVWVEVSTPLIPGFNDQRDSLSRISERLCSLSADIPWHLLRFTPEYHMSTYRPTHPEELRRAVDIAHEGGLNHVYVERALGQAARCTFCPRCGSEVVTRGLWKALAVGLSSEGACHSCGFSIAGRWGR